MTSDEFHKIDYLIMEKAFAIHNKYGRFQDESTYRDELAYQTRKIGFSVETEVPLKIEYGSFHKTYFLDTVVNEFIIYELKVIDAICNHSRSQTLNYQLISEIPFGKIINFGANSVEHEFSTTKVTRSARNNFQIRDTNFSVISLQSLDFINLYKELLAAWGTHLELDLYKDAIIHFLSGEQKVISRVNIRSGNRIIGSKLTHQISDGEAFKITGISNPATMRPHLQRFLNNADLKVIHWINMNKHHIEIQTLHKQQSYCP